MNMNDICKLPVNTISKKIVFFLWSKMPERRMSMMSLKEQEIYEDKVMQWIDDNFVLNEIEIEDYPFFLHGKLVRDKQGETMVVFWCVIYGRVDYRFQDA